MKKQTSLDNFVNSTPKKRKIDSTENNKTDEKQPDSKKPKIVGVIENLKMQFSSSKEVDNHFQRISDYLFNKVVFSINGVEARFAEIEFYLTTKKSSVHPDPFTHCDKLQKQLGIWYFHRQDNGAYKSGSYKGMDIAIGNGDEWYGGILIRSILVGDQFIEGPCLCVNFILEKFGVKDIPELVDEKLKKNISIEGTLLCIKEKEQTPKVEPFRCPRVGLTLKKSSDRDLRVEYICKQYRFIAFPEKQKKGKPNMILGLHQQLGKASSVQKICKKLGIKQKNIVQKYIDIYDKNKNAKVDKYFGKNIKTEDLCAMCGILNNYM